MPVSIHVSKTSSNYIVSCCIGNNLFVIMLIRTDIKSSLFDIGSILPLVGKTWGGGLGLFIGVYFGGLGLFIGVYFGGLSLFIGVYFGGLGLFIGVYFWKF